MKTVASVSFLDNQSLSMDVENVTAIRASRPLKMAEDSWFCELVIETENGKIALQLLGDDPEAFQVSGPDDDLLERE